MEPKNGQAPESPEAENKTSVSIGQIADGLVAHILSMTAGNLHTAASISNLVNFRLMEEYRYLLTKQFDGKYEAFEKMKAAAANQKGDSNAKH